MQKKHILVVDDVPSNLKFAEQLLESTYKLTLALSGIHALKFLTKIHPDLILLDLNMPDLDGCETLRRIKSDNVLSNIPVIILTSETNTNTEVDCLRLGAVDFIRKPFVTEIMLSRIETQLELSSYRNELERRVAEKTFMIERLQDVTVTSFAEMVESRDGTTGGHIKNTTRYFKVFLDEISLRPEYSDIITENYKRNLIKAAPMHDIGKIGINDSVLRKEAALDKEEFEHMKTHAMIGGETFQKIFDSIDELHHSELGANTFQKIYDTLRAEINEDTEFLRIAKEMALCHHERWNGTGYPNGISGEDIPLSARILSIVDVYDALTSVRPYKKAFSHEEAMDIIKADKWIYFDPSLTDIFIDINERIKECLLTKIESDISPIQI